MEPPPPPTQAPGAPSLQPPPSGGGGCDRKGGAASSGQEVAVVGVRLAGQVRIAQYNSGDLSFELGDRIVVEGEGGTEIGEVAQPSTRARKMCAIGCMKMALRVATADDLAFYERRAAQEAEA